MSFVSKSHRFLIATHNISKNEKIYIMFHQRLPHPVHDHIKTNYSHWCTMNVEKEKSTFFIKDQSPDDERTQKHQPLSLSLTIPYRQL